jgi:hypothetical protein
MNNENTNWQIIALSEYEDGYRDGQEGKPNRYSSVPYLRGYEAGIESSVE